jgi:glutathione S-transferase
VRRYLYSALLPNPRSGIQEVLFDGVSAGQSRLGRLAFPITRRLMIAGMKCPAALTPRLEEKLAVELDWFDAEVEERRFPGGNELGRADITAASLLSPLARPAALPLYRRLTYPAPVEEVLTRWSSRPSLRWVNRLYDEHRRLGRSQPDRRPA